MLTFYGYKKCSTCRNAMKWLDDRKIAYEFTDITEHPPTKQTLRRVLANDGYELRHLFNTSGQLYREMNIKARLPEMNQDEALDLLASHGKLIKRPIVLDPQGRATVGFKPDIFEQAWG